MKQKYISQCTVSHFVVGHRSSASLHLLTVYVYQPVFRETQSFKNKSFDDSSREDFGEHKYIAEVGIISVSCSIRRDKVDHTCVCNRKSEHDKHYGDFEMIDGENVIILPQIQVSFAGSSPS